LYQWFRRNFSRVVQSLTKLMQKLGPFHWRLDQKRGFTEFQSSFTTAPELANFDYEQGIVHKCDAWNYLSAGVLSQ
jgi:hypothetical protein